MKQRKSRKPRAPRPKLSALEVLIMLDFIAKRVDRIIDILSQFF